MNALYRLSAGAALTAALLAPTSAFAWKHWSADEDGGRVIGAWAREDLPIDYCIGPLPDDASMPAEAFREGIVLGFDQWNTAAPCAQLSAVPDPGECAKNDWWKDTDNQNSVTFMHEDDGGGSHFSPGVLGATVSTPQFGGQFLFNRDGRRYTRITDSDIVFNMDYSWTTPEAVEAGTCADQIVFQSVATHEIGHLHGMGHSCDKKDICLDAEYLDATMFWNSGSCDAKQITLNDDDIEGITALYGPYATFVCNRELDPADPETLAFGVVPFDLQCVVDAPNMDELTKVTWSWGDGETSEGIEATHTYTTAGNFTMNVDFNGNSEQCGDWQYREGRTGYVRSCDVPAPEFTFEHVDGLTYQLLNNTDLTVYGCIYDVQWDIFDSNGTKIKFLNAWEPKFTFEAAGDYRIVLNIGGPAGTGASELTLSAKNSRGDNYGTCATAPNGAGALVGLLGVLVVIGRRKRA